MTRPADLTEPFNDGCIDITAGVFGVLDEELRKVKKVITIPARANTDCKCRQTSKCNVNCPRAITGFQSGYKISYQRKGMRI
jgi:hypothetical protein